MLADPLFNAIADPASLVSDAFYKTKPPAKSP